MKKTQKIIEKIKQDSNCIWSPPEGEPNLPDEIIIPKDLSAFYQSIGCLILFPNADFPLHIYTA